MLLSCAAGEDSWESLGLRSNHSILKEISPEYSLEGLMVKLKLQYFGHWSEESAHWKRPWCWKKNWGQEEKGAAKDEMVGWHLWLSGHEFEQTLGDSEGQGSLVCCSSWGRKESDMTGWLNNNNWFKTTYSGILFKAKTYYYTPFSSSVAFITSSYYN